MKERDVSTLEIRDGEIPFSQVTALLSDERPRIYVQEVLELCGLNPWRYWLTHAVGKNAWRIVKRAEMPRAYQYAMVPVLLAEQTSGARIVDRCP
jgi:hypothetical protein